jgi:hypothetical protein
VKWSILTRSPAKRIPKRRIVDGALRVLSRHLRIKVHTPCRHAVPTTIGHRGCWFALSVPSHVTLMGPSIHWNWHAQKVPSLHAGSSASSVLNVLLQGISPVAGSSSLICRRLALATEEEPKRFARAATAPSWYGSSWWLDCDSTLL